MQFTVENVAPCRKRVALTIPAARISGAIENSFRQAAANLRVPGFRPGHIPRAFIEKRYGDQIRLEVKEQLVNEGYQEALRDNNIVPLSSPEIDLANLKLDDPNGVKIDLEFDTRPEFEPKNYKNIAVTVDKHVASDEEIEAQIAEIRKMRRRPEQDNAHTMDDNAYGLATVTFKLGERVVLERPGVRVMPGMALQGADVQEFQDKLKGRTTGDSFSLKLTFPADFEVYDARNQEGVATIAITEMYRLIPPTDEELLKEVDIADMDTLRSDVRRRVDEARASHFRRSAEEVLMEKAAEENRFELPNRVVDNQVDQRIQQHLQHLARQNQLPEQIDEMRKQEREKLWPEMEKGLRRLFLVDSIARKEKIYVTEEDLEGEFRTIAERNQSTPEEVIQYYHQNNLMGALRIDLLETKVRAFLFENANKTEKEV